METAIIKARQIRSERNDVREDNNIVDDTEETPNETETEIETEPQSNEDCSNDTGPAAETKKS